MGALNSLVQPIWFGHYVLTARIATGGMAEVYVGRQLGPGASLEQMVAVKRLLPHHVKTAEIVRMFLNEARITAQIRHPNVVKIFELGQVANEPFIAMELLEGKSFEEMRAKTAEQGHRLPLPLALYILTEACRGLDAAHRAVDESGQSLALVHRDFTPDNIHVGFAGEVKVIDFGIARTGTWGNGTEPGILKGKFFYMSPEMVLGRPVDNRADLFAAGVMLYEQLCGRRPFSGLSVEEVLSRISTSALKPPSAYDPSVPAGLEAIALRALQPDPDDRYPSLAEFVEAIEQEAGPMPLIRKEEITVFLEGEFPPELDTRRQALQQARQVDALLPGMLKVITDPSLAGATAATVMRRSAPVESKTIAERVRTLRLRLSTVVSLLRGRAARPRLAIAVGALLGAGLTVAVLVFGARGGKTAGELLAEAEAATTVPMRSSAYVAMALADGVTTEELQRGGRWFTRTAAWDQALTYSAAWRTAAPDALEPLLLEAKAATQLRLRKRAETAIADAEKLAPASELPDVAMAELRAAQGDFEAALVSWGHARRRKPEVLAYAAQVGVMQSRLGRFDDAVDTLEGVLRREFDATAAAELGYVKFRKEQHADAYRWLSEAVKVKPDLMLAHYYLAPVLYHRGELDGAREQYLAADRLAGDDARPLLGLCQLEAQQGSPKLDEVKQLVRVRFPKEAASLLSQCAP